MKSHLQVKVFSMAAEMSYIRRKENQWKAKARYARQRQQALSDREKKETAASSQTYAENAFWSLRFHRDGMKAEARTSHLAYGFMKGRSYQRMEHICYGVIKGYGSSEPDWKAIESMVGRFTKDETSPQNWMQLFTQWLEAAKVWYEGNKGRIEAFNRGRPARLAALKAAKKPYEGPKVTGGALPAVSNASHHSQ